MCPPNAWPKFRIDYDDHYTYHQPQFYKNTNLIIVDRRYEITWSPSNVPTDWPLTGVNNNFLHAISMLNLPGTNLLWFFILFAIIHLPLLLLRNTRLFSNSWALPQWLQNPRSHEIRSTWRGGWNHLSRVAGCKKDCRLCKRAIFVWIFRMDG